PDAASVAGLGWAVLHHRVMHGHLRLDADDVPRYPARPQLPELQSLPRGDVAGIGRIVAPGHELELQLSRLGAPDELGSGGVEATLGGDPLPLAWIDDPVDEVIVEAELGVAWSGQPSQDGQGNEGGDGV